MSDPGKAATPSFEEQVNQIASQLTQGEDGNWQLPQDVKADDNILFAAKLEKRRRDTQSALAKTREKVSVLEAERDEFVKEFETHMKNTLTPTQMAELNELKVTDPDAWLEKKREYEEANNTTIAAKKTDVSAKAQKAAELERRKALLEAFNEQNPTIKITDEVLKNDVPPRFLQKLEAGEIEFDQFLTDVGNYLTTNKVLLSGEQAPNIPDMSKAAGSTNPTAAAIDSEVRNSYKNETY